MVGDPLVDKELLKKKLKYVKVIRILTTFFCTQIWLFLNKFNNEELINSGLTKFLYQLILGMLKGIKNTMDLTDIVIRLWIILKIYFKINKKV